METYINQSVSQEGSCTGVTAAYVVAHDEFEVRWYRRRGLGQDRGSRIWTAVHGSILGLSHTMGG